METITVYVQILEKEVTSLSGSVDLVKEHEKLLLNQNFSKALIVGYIMKIIYQRIYVINCLTQITRKLENEHSNPQS